MNFLSAKDCAILYVLFQLKLTLKSLWAKCSYYAHTRNEGTGAEEDVKQLA